MHEQTLTKLTLTTRTNGFQRLDFCLVLDIFQSLFSSVIDLYVDFCSRQNESSRQLEAKVASDIRFKQLVSESQRNLRKLVEHQIDAKPENGDDTLKGAERARAIRNSNLPLTSFLIKPTQRITKYGLLFDRMLKVTSEGPPDHKHLQPRLERLKQSAEALCQQVNEACRLKEDDADNDRQLRWCQSHIRQQGSGASPQDNWSSRSSFSRSSMSSVELRFSSSMSAGTGPHDPASLSTELIQFNSNTNCLGQRRLIKAASLLKLRSGRELVAFLFNDFLLLTQVKGAASMRVEDVFKSERAQQAYYKFYRPPIMLEDIQLDDFENEQLFQSLSCPSIASSSSSSVLSKEQEGLMISFLDRQSGCIHNLLAMSEREKNHWAQVISKKVNEAKAVRAARRTARSRPPMDRLNASDCLGRLFVTVLELTRITSSPASHRPAASLADLSSSWERRPGSLNQIDSTQNVCVRMQMHLYERIQMNQSDEKRVLPISDEFQTNPVLINDSRRQPMMADMNEAMTNLDVQRDKHRFECDSTQFLIAKKSFGSDRAHEYLDIELIDDSRFRETRLIGRKRISMDQLLGRGEQVLASRELARKIANQSSRSIQVVPPNRPVDMTFKLKPVSAGQACDLQRSPSSPSSSRSATLDQQRFNLKLRFHLQLFCDTPSLI